MKVLLITFLTICLITANEKLSFAQKFYTKICIPEDVIENEIKSNLGNHSDILMAVLSELRKQDFQFVGSEFLFMV